MTTAIFSMRNHKPCGFYVQGHSGFANRGEDIVCSAVSSAVLLVANVLEGQVPIRARCEDGVFSLFCDAPHPLLQGLLVHLKGIASQYPQNLRICYLNLNGGN